MRPPGSTRRLLLAGIASLLACATAAGAGTPPVSTAADPLDSPRWGDMHKQFFDAQPVVFDARIKVTGPAVAEDPLNVPITAGRWRLP